jgi:hypothetical protein
MRDWQDIFALFVSLLENIGDVTSSYFLYHAYVLESLAQIKSIVLLANMEHAEEMIMTLLRGFFKSAR